MSLRQITPNECSQVNATMHFMLVDTVRSEQPQDGCSAA